MKKWRVVVLFVFMTLLFFSGEASAKFVSEHDAKIVVKNWLEMMPTESFTMEGMDVGEVMRFEGEIYGTPGYYVVLLAPDGWVIVPADDSFEAIIAFGQGSFSREEYASSPLSALLRVNAADENNNVGKASVYSVNNQIQRNLRVFTEAIKETPLYDAREMELSIIIDS